MKSLLIVLLFYCVSTECFEIVSVRQVKDSTRTKRETGSHLPDHLEFDLQSKTRYQTHLKLNRLPDIPTYIFTEDGLEKYLGESEDTAVYTVEDDKIGVVQVRRTNTSTDTDDHYQLEGEFVVENEIFQINPVKGGLGRLEKADDGREKDYHELSSPHPDYRQEQKPETRYKRAVNVYTAELCFIIDAEDYQNRFLSTNNYDENKAVAGARVFYSYVMEQMRLRYVSTYEVDLSFRFNLVLTGLVILKERTDSEFLEKLVKENGDNRGTLDYNDALDEAIDWLFIKEKTLPPSDHYMFFTSYDLADGDALDSLGLANLASMCYRDENGKPLSASIIENGFDANVGATAAHELGHCLNADHDTDAGCDDNDLYLMSARALHPKGPDQASHPWKFSNCSVRDFGVFLKTENISCLLDTKRSTDILQKPSTKDGRYYNLDVQCEMAFGDQSEFCQEKYTDLASQKTFCYKVYCTDPDGDCKPIFPRDYTECDQNYWCYKGECVKVFGDKIDVVLEGDNTEIHITEDTHEVLPFVKYTKASTYDVIGFNYQWNPEFAETFFHFNKSNGRITVKNGALFNISEAEVFITATTNETATSPPISIVIYIYDKSHTPKFAQQRFVIKVTSEQMDSLQTPLVVMPDLNQLLSKEHQEKDVEFQIQNSEHSSLVRLKGDNQLVLDKEKLKLAELSNFTVTLDAIYKNILRNFTTLEFVVNSEDEIPTEPQKFWLIPVIIVSCFAVGGLIIFLIIKIRSCHSSSNKSFDEPSSPLPKLNQNMDSKDGGNLSPVFTPL